MVSRDWTLVMVLEEVGVVEVMLVTGEVIGSVGGLGRDGIVCLSFFLFVLNIRLKLTLIRLSPGSSSPPIPGVNNDIASAVSLFRSRS